jgi:hypothetical protein
MVKILYFVYYQLCIFLMSQTGLIDWHEHATSYKEDHMRLADLLLVLDKGELTHAGPPGQVLTVLREKKP